MTGLTLSEADLDELESIMDEEDNDLVKWILGTEPTPQHLQTPLFQRLASYRPDFEEIAERFGITR